MRQMVMMTNQTIQTAYWRWCFPGGEEEDMVEEEPGEEEEVLDPRRTSRSKVTAQEVLESATANMENMAPKWSPTRVRRGMEVAGEGMSQG